MKKNKLLIGVLVASTVTTFVTPSVTLAADSQYKNGVFIGEGGGFRVISNKNGEIQGENQVKIKVNVTFEDNKITKLLLPGININNEEKYVERTRKGDPNHLDNYRYPDDTDYLAYRRGAENTGAIEIFNIIKDKGIEKIDEIISDLKEIYEDNTKSIYLKKTEYKPISGATATAIGIAEAVKSASESAKIAVENKVINLITVESGPSDMMEYTPTKALNALEGDHTNFEGLKVRIDYSDETSEIVEFKDFEKKGIQLLKIDSGSDTEIIKPGMKVKFDNVNRGYTFKILDPVTKHEAIINEVTKELEYYPTNIEFKVGNGDFRNINIESNDYNKSIFSDLKRPNFNQNIELRTSDLGRNFIVRVNKAKHERTKKEIDTYMLYEVATIPENADVNTTISVKPIKLGKVSSDIIRLDVKKIVDDKEEQIKSLDQLIDKIELDKTLENNEIIKKLLNDAKEIKFNVKDNTSAQIAEAVEDFNYDYNYIKNNSIKHDKKVAIELLRKKLEKVNTFINSMSDGHEKLQNNDIKTYIENKILEDEKYPDVKAKIDDLEKIHNEINDLFKKPEYVDVILNYVNPESWKLNIRKDPERFKDNPEKQKAIEEENNNKAKILHDLRVDLLPNIKEFKNKYLPNDDSLYYSKNFKKNVKDMILDESQKDLLEETKAYFSTVGIREKIEFLKRDKSLNVKPVSLYSIESYSDALDFILKDIPKNSPSISVPSSMLEDKKEEITNNITRISGEDRYDTSISMSKSMFNSSDKVYLVSGVNFADAISSSGLTMKKDGPVLLINELSVGKIMDEINRLGAKDIVIVGGKSAVSDAINKKLKDNKNIKNITRLSGEDRFDTSIKSSEKILNEFGNKGKVIVVSGINIADAISISPYASKEGLPILLADKNGLTKNQIKFIKENKLNDALIIGGNNSVNKSVDSIFKKSSRISGADRYETSAKIASELFKNSENIFFASGEVFADALSGSYYAANKNAPILLVNNNDINNIAKDVIKKSKTRNILGGMKSVSNKISSIIEKLK